MMVGGSRERDRGSRGGGGLAGAAPAVGMDTDTTDGHDANTGADNCDGGGCCVDQRVLVLLLGTGHGAAELDHG